MISETPMISATVDSLYSKWLASRSPEDREAFREALRAYHQEFVDGLARDRGYDPKLTPVVRITLADDPESPDITVHLPGSPS